MIPSPRISNSTIAVLFGSMALIFTLLVVLDRAGAPLGLIESATLYCVCAAMAIIGLFGATMRPSIFFVAGRVAASVGMASAQFLLLITILAPHFDRDRRIALSAILVATLALILGGVLFSARLRRSGVYTLTDYFKHRFNHWLPALCVCFASLVSLVLVGLVAFTLTLNTLIASLGLTLEAALVIMGLIAILSVAVGGLRSVLLVTLTLTAAVIVGFIAIAGFQQGTLPLENLANIDVVALIQQRMRQWLGAEQTDSFSTGLWPTGGWLKELQPLFSRDGLISMAGALIGLAAFLPIFGFSAAARSPGSAIRASGFTVILLAAAIPVSWIASSGAVLHLDTVVTGASSDALPLFVSDGRLSGVLTICGADAKGEAIPRACEKQPSNLQSGNLIARGSVIIKPTDIALKSEALSGRAGFLLGLPLALAFLYQMAPAMIGLGALGLVLFALSTLLGHDLLYRIFAPKAVTSGRLGAVRLFWLLSFLVLLDFVPLIPAKPELLIHAALAIAAAIIAPMLLLSLLPRAGSVTANLTLVTSIGTGLLIAFVAPDQPLTAGLGAFVAACFIAMAGLASCPPGEPEQAFALALATRSDEPLIIDRGV